MKSNIRRKESAPRLIAQRQHRPLAFLCTKGLLPRDTHWGTRLAAAANMSVLEWVTRAKWTPFLPRHQGVLRSNVTAGVLALTAYREMHSSPDTFGLLRFYCAQGQSRTSGSQGPTPIKSPIHLTWLFPLPCLSSVLSDMLFTLSLPSSSSPSHIVFCFLPPPPLLPWPLPCSDKMPKKTQPHFHRYSGSNWYLLPVLFFHYLFFSLSHYASPHSETCKPDNHHRTQTAILLADSTERAISPCCQALTDAAECCGAEHNWLQQGEQTTQVWPDIPDCHSFPRLTRWAAISLSPSLLRRHQLEGMLSLSRYCRKCGGHHFLTLGHIASYRSHVLKDYTVRLFLISLGIVPDTMNDVIWSGMHFPAMQPDLPASNDHRKVVMLLGHVEGFYLV